jgi:hypothetical protein
MTGKIPLAAVPVKAPPVNTILVWPKAHPLVAETKDGLSHVLVDLSVFNEEDIERIDISEVEPLPPSIELAWSMADLEAELEVMRQETVRTSGGASRAKPQGWCVRRPWMRLVRYCGPARSRPGTGLDPDRPLLQFLNRAGGEPVLVMCGRPGKRDPAHAAAGRLPARFHKYSDVRLLWREFRAGYGRMPTSTAELHGFAAAILLTNAGEPLVDSPITMVMAAFAAAGQSALWGEAGAGGSVAWHENFAIRPFVDERGLRIGVERLVVEAEA